MLDGMNYFSQIQINFFTAVDFPFTSKRLAEVHLACKFPGQKIEQWERLRDVWNHENQKENPMVQVILN